jgi:hypothetical protein
MLLLLQLLLLASLVGQHTGLKLSKKAAELQAAVMRVQQPNAQVMHTHAYIDSPQQSCCISWKEALVEQCN